MRNKKKLSRRLKKMMVSLKLAKSTTSETILRTIS